MKKLVICLTLALTGCELTEAEHLLTQGRHPPEIYRSYPYIWHDDQYQVTCWISDGISCLPDSQIHHESAN